ncbi:SAM-dependent methyltransferase [Sporosarcina sp. GW1-11]|uniref:class I SAM-dependent methyltransferase n=1 Tax=Sporosarcina sp. GW1-11 TaxID=2899126 RepID=UPI00294FC860|nr:SAM-dependent methyltransferase [Sporosarcina sp. GW1-11]MDV6378456.1 SAM-dependent methyltransferase [Sporosarcina sp. GW1-11]
MSVDDVLELLQKRMTDGSFIRATISQPRLKSNEIKRIKLKPIELRDEFHIQFEYQHERVLKHENVAYDDVALPLQQALENYKQFHIDLTNETIQIQISKKMKVSIKRIFLDTEKTVDYAHNRIKQYALKEGTPYPFLIRLGVQTPEGKVKNQKHDKFRQINRFVELIDDTLSHLPKDRPIRILDFGSGKSYLTFALYHYLRIEKGLDIRVTGLDLKKEVIEECQKIAHDLQYDHLEFLVGDINEYSGDTAVDMVVTLHACDVATDMALAKAVTWGASVILSVPCCQHELFTQLQAPALNVMLQHGLVKERFAALATDSIRAELLTLVGYEAQLVEFIDMEHTPKNILIRAYRNDKKPSQAQIERYVAFRDLLQATPFLENELKALLKFIPNNDSSSIQ